MVRNIQLAEEFINAFPEAAARVLEEQTPDSASVVVDAIADELSVKALANMLPYHAARCLQRLSTDSAAKYLRGIAPQLAAAILRHTDLSYRTEILDAMPHNARTRVRAILRYARSTVGAWTDTLVLAVPLSLQAGNALARYRKDQDIKYPTIYVVDDKQRLCGALGIATLLRSADDVPLSKVMQPVGHQVRASASLESALLHAGWNVADHLPVSDRAGGFMGVLHYVDLRRAVAEQPLAGPQETVPGTIMDLTNNLYLGMADLMTASLAPEIFRAPSKP